MTQDPNQHPESSPEPDANDPLAPENVESLADYDDQEADDEGILSPTQKRVVELEVELAVR
jgi:hypothetical protein